MRRLSKTQVHYALLAVLILCASCLRIFVCFQHNPLNYLVSDSWRHWVSGLRFPRGTYFGAADPIGYQVYICILRRITGDRSFLIALAASLLSVVMPWTYYRAARNFGLSKLPALWLWALIACTPSLLVIYHYVMMETLLLVLDGVALWMTARYLRKGGRAAFLVCVASWMFACLTKPTVIPLAGVCLLWVWWKKSPPVRDVLTATVMALILLVPQSIRSKIGLGFIAPFGNPWLAAIEHKSGVKMLSINFHVHANPYLHLESDRVYDMFSSSPSDYIQPLAPLSDWRIRRAAGNSSLTVEIDSSRGSEDWRRAYASLNVSAGEWLAQWRENIVLFLFAPSWPETAVGQWDGRMVFWARWLWAPLILVLLVLNVSDFVNRRFNLIPVATTVFILALGLQNMVTAEGRYRKPLEPLPLLNLVYVVAGKNDRRAETRAATQTVLQSEHTSEAEVDDVPSHLN
jgi:hypothetical protein